MCCGKVSEFGFFGIFNKVPSSSISFRVILRIIETKAVLIKDGNNEYEIISLYGRYFDNNINNVSLYNCYQYHTELGWI